MYLQNFLLITLVVSELHVCPGQDMDGRTDGRTYGHTNGLIKRKLYDLLSGSITTNKNVSFKMMRFYILPRSVCS